MTSKPYSKESLWKIRNLIPINTVIVDLLKMDVRPGNGLLRFRCPVCMNFHSATNPKTNLARCFDCQMNFNPIDMVIAVTHCSFLDAAEKLTSMVDP